MEVFSFSICIFALQPHVDVLDFSSFWRSWPFTASIWSRSRLLLFLFAAGSEMDSRLNLFLYSFQVCWILFLLCFPLPKLLYLSFSFHFLEVNARFSEFDFIYVLLSLFQRFSQAFEAVLRLSQYTCWWFWCFFVFEFWFMLLDFRWIVFIGLSGNLCLWAVVLSTSVMKRTRLFASRFGWLCGFLILILLWQCACVLARWHPLSSPADSSTSRPHVGVKRLWAPALSSSFLSLPHVPISWSPIIITIQVSLLSSEVFHVGAPASLPRELPPSSHIAPTSANFTCILQLQYSITLFIPLLHLHPTSQTCQHLQRLEPQSHLKCLRSPMSCLASAIPFRLWHLTLSHHILMTP